MYPRSQFDDALEHTKQFHDSGVGHISLERDDLEIHVCADNLYPAALTIHHLINERAIAKLSEGGREEINEKVTDLEEQ